MTIKEKNEKLPHMILDFGLKFPKTQLNKHVTQPPYITLENFISSAIAPAGRLGSVVNIR